MVELAKAAADQPYSHLTKSKRKTKLVEQDPQSLITSGGANINIIADILNN